MKIIQGEVWRDGRIQLKRDDDCDIDYACWDRNCVQLDGRFSIEELKAIVTFIEELK